MYLKLVLGYLQAEDLAAEVDRGAVHRPADVLPRVAAETVAVVVKISLIQGEKRNKKMRSVTT